MAIPSSGAVSFSAIQTEFGGSNPIGLNEYYAGGAYVPSGTTGTNGAVPSSGAICVNKFHGTSKLVPSSQSYTTAGTYTWVAPAGVTSVSVVAIGGGGGGGVNGGGNAGGSGAGLGYVNNYSTTPGSSYTVVVGAGGAKQTACPGGNLYGGTSYFVSTGVVSGVGGRSGYRSSGISGGSFSGTGGGAGGASRCSGCGAGGGGAGGYSGAGGRGGSGNCCSRNATAGTGGGGGGGGYNDIGGAGGGGGGGGTGLFGQGSNGAAGAGHSGGGGGSGGSSGTASTNGTTPGQGGAYGAGSGGSYCGCICNVNGKAGAGGAVRIMWPGTTRSFPSTCAGSP